MSILCEILQLAIALGPIETEIAKMDQNVAQFVDLLHRASALIEPGYFFLPVAGQDAPVLRERVYSYELYHQLRCLWPTPDQWDFALNGELDKRGHPLAEMQVPLVENRIPDLLVHNPGDMTGNLAVVEIKSTSNIGAIEGDLFKLAAFCGVPNYRAGISLIFGSPAFRARVTETGGQFLQHHCPKGIRDRIMIFLHDAPGAEMYRIV